MQADWDVEIGADAPVIDACWPGFVDLRSDHQNAIQLPEVKELPPLSETLVRLNGPGSPVWTTKCDVWVPGQGDWDRDELDATEASAVEALACYVDLLPRSSEQWPSPNDAVRDCRALCERLQGIPIRSCRVDLVVRSSRIQKETFAYGITVYFAACGETVDDARNALRNALMAFADAVCTPQPACGP